MSIILDVRAPDAFQRGSIMGAQNVPLRHLMKQLKQLSPTATIVMVDDDGTIAPVAKQYAMDMGFTNVRTSTIARMHGLK